MLRESLIFDHPGLPLPARVGRGDRAGTIGNRLGRISDVLVVRRVWFWRRSKSQFAMGVKVKLPGRSCFGRPAVVRDPLVAARLKHHGFWTLAALVPEVVGKKRRLNLGAKMLARITVEIHAAEFVAW